MTQAYNPRDWPSAWPWQVRTSCDAERFGVQIFADAFLLQYEQMPPGLSAAFERYQPSAEVVEGWASAELNVSVQRSMISLPGEVLNYQIRPLGIPDSGLSRSTYDLILEFVQRDRRTIMDTAPSLTEFLLFSFPLPAFGSPPSGWQSLAAKVGGTSYAVLMLGTEGTTQQPVLVLLEGTAATIIWFVWPAIRVARRALAERVAKALKTELTDTDT
jgi:hypothetical protein